MTFCGAQVAFLTQADILPWRKNEDLPRIEHRREPPEAATCSDAVEADSR